MESMESKVANVSLPDFDLDFMDLGGSVHILLDQGLEVVEDIWGGPKINELYLGIFGGS